MNNNELDNILKTLLEKHDTDVISSDEFRDIFGRWDRDNLSFLEKREYVRLYKEDRPPYWRISLTVEGKHFIKNGGFEREEYLKNEPIRISQEAYKFSKFALIISCLVALLVGSVQLVCNNTQSKEVNQHSSNQKSVSSPHVSNTIHFLKFEDYVKD